MINVISAQKIMYIKDRKYSKTTTLIICGFPENVGLSEQYCLQQGAKHICSHSTLHINTISKQQYSNCYTPYYIVMDF